MGPFSNENIFTAIYVIHPSNNSFSIDFVCLCLCKTLAIIKPIAVTQLSDAGEMETVTDIKIDLSKLQKLNEYFGVSEIQEEVTFQVGHVGKMVILYRNAEMEIQ